MIKKTNLIILETSDVHGNIYPINYSANRSMDVGLGKLSVLIKKERAAGKNVLLIDNGDLIQGTPLLYHYARINHSRPNPMVILANAIGYDCAVFGNHEFNYGREILRKAVKESSFPWLSANLLDKTTGRPYYGNPYIIRAFPEGFRAAVLGLTTHYIPNWEKPENIEHLVFEDAVEAAKRWVPFLRKKEQADIVIVSYHGGFERDLRTGEPIEALTGENQGYRLCREVPGIDALLTGHQHRQISGEKVNGVVVVQPGDSGAFLGKVTLDLEEQADGRWRIIEKGSALIPVQGVKEDKRLLRLTDSYELAAQQWLDRPLGKIEGDMTVSDPMAIRTGDNPLIEFINRIQMKAAGCDISSTALFTNDSPGFPERVTMRDIVANYVYPNTLKVIRVSGRDIKEALERSASYFKQYRGGPVEASEAFTVPKPQHYNYDMWEGIDYLIDIKRPAGQRIVKLDYRGRPLDMAREYDVVMNNYRSGGGGNYPMFKNKPVIKDIPIDVTELLANEILKKKVVKAAVDHNWKVIY